MSVERDGATVREYLPAAIVADRRRSQEPTGLLKAEMCTLWKGPDAEHAGDRDRGVRRPLRESEL